MQRLLLKTTPNESYWIILAKAFGSGLFDGEDIGSDLSKATITSYTSIQSFLQYQDSNEIAELIIQQRNGDYLDSAGRRFNSSIEALKSSIPANAPFFIIRLPDNSTCL